MLLDTSSIVFVYGDEDTDAEKTLNHLESLAQNTLVVMVSANEDHTSALPYGGWLKQNIFILPAGASIDFGGLFVLFATGHAQVEKHPDVDILFRADVYPVTPTVRPDVVITSTSIALHPAMVIGGLTSRPHVAPEHLVVHPSLAGKSHEDQTSILSRKLGRYLPDLPKPLTGSHSVGVGIAAPPGAGKSAILRALHEALTAAGIRTELIGYDATKIAMEAAGDNVTGTRPYMRFIAAVSRAMWAGAVVLVDHCLAPRVASDMRSLFAGYGTQFILCGLDDHVYEAQAPVWAGRVCARCADPTMDGSTLFPDETLDEKRAVVVVGKKIREIMGSAIDYTIDMTGDSDSDSISSNHSSIADKIARSAVLSDVELAYCKKAVTPPTPTPSVLADAIMADLGLSRISHQPYPLHDLPVASLCWDGERLAPPTPHPDAPTHPDRRYVTCVPWGRGPLHVGDRVKHGVALPELAFRTIRYDHRPGCVGIMWFSFTKRAAARQLHRRTQIQRIRDALAHVDPVDAPDLDLEYSTEGDVDDLPDAGSLSDGPVPVDLLVATPVAPRRWEEDSEGDSDDDDDDVRSEGDSDSDGDVPGGHAASVPSFTPLPPSPFRRPSHGDPNRPPRSRRHRAPYRRQNRQSELRDALTHAGARPRAYSASAPQPKVTTVDLATQPDDVAWRLVMAGRRAHPVTGWTVATLTAAHKETDRVGAGGGSDHFSHLLMDGFAEEQYVTFRARCLADRAAQGTGGSWEMNTLYRFWTYFLREHPHTLRRGMMAEFRQLAWDDAENRTHKQRYYGVECLFRCYAFALEARHVPYLWVWFIEDVVRDARLAHKMYGLAKFIATLQYMPEGRPRPTPIPELATLLKQYPTLEAVSTAGQTRGKARQGPGRGRDKRHEPKDGQGVYRPPGHRAQGRGQGRGRGPAGGKAMDSRSWRRVE